MNAVKAEAIYQTLTGSTVEACQVPGVENAFADGSACAALYEQIYYANQRLCERLGQIDSDPDVELIINNFLEINKQLCLKMYHYGQTSHTWPAVPAGNA